MIYTSVVERKKEFAIMKSLGYTHSSVSKLVLIEVMLLSLIGTAIGVPLGIWFGDLFMQAILSLFEFDLVYALNWKTPTVMAIVIGLLFPIIFSLFPIYNAGKASVLLTLKMEKETDASSRKPFIRGCFGRRSSMLCISRSPYYLCSCIIRYHPFVSATINRFKYRHESYIKIAYLGMLASWLQKTSTSN